MNESDIILLLVFLPLSSPSVHFLSLTSTVSPVFGMCCPHVHCLPAPRAEGTSESDSALYRLCPDAWSHDEGGTHSHMIFHSTTELLFQGTGTNWKNTHTHNTTPCLVPCLLPTHRDGTSSGVCARMTSGFTHWTGFVDTVSFKRLAVRDTHKGLLYLCYNRPTATCQESTG